MSDFGEKGQLKLKQAKVLVIGAGGLGCPVLSYLTAAGIGLIGIVDFDKVEISNLQRQVLFESSQIGIFKAEAAKEKLLKLLMVVALSLKTGLSILGIEAVLKMSREEGE